MSKEKVCLRVKGRHSLYVLLGLAESLSKGISVIGRAKS